MKKVWIYKRRRIKGWWVGWYESGKRKANALPSKAQAEHYRQIKYAKLNSDVFTGTITVDWQQIVEEYRHDKQVAGIVEDSLYEVALTLRHFERLVGRCNSKQITRGRRICIDEFGPLNLQPRHGKHYARIGHVDRLRATYSRKGGVRYMFGAYDMERDTLVGIFAMKKNWMSFLAFLKWLRRRYPRDEVLHVVLDNAGYYLKAEVLIYAAQHKIKLYWTPTNASWLNRIESHFTALRKFALDNTDYHSHQEQQEAIERYLSRRNHTREISLEDWKSYRRSQKKAA